MIVAIVPLLAGLVPAFTVTVPLKSVALDNVTVLPVPAPIPANAAGALPLPTICEAANVPDTVKLCPEGTLLLLSVAPVSVADEIVGAVLVTISLPVPS